MCEVAAISQVEVGVQYSLIHLGKKKRKRLGGYLSNVRLFTAFLHWAGILLYLYFLLSLTAL